MPAASSTVSVHAIKIKAAALHTCLLYRLTCAHNGPALHSIASSLYDLACLLHAYVLHAYDLACLLHAYVVRAYDLACL